MEPHKRQSGHSEYDFVRAAQRGELAAMRQVADHACSLALRTAYAVIGGPEQARDVSQDVAVDVVRGLPSLRDPESLDAWIHRITVRHARRALGRQRLRREVEVPAAFADDAIDSTADPELLHLKLVLADVVAQLPPKQRLVIALRYVHDLSDKDIASAMGCREGTVHSLLSRARDSLRTSPDLAEFRPAMQGGQR